MKTAVRMMTTVSLLTLMTACGGGGGGAGGSGGGSIKAYLIDAPVQGVRYQQDIYVENYFTTSDGGFICEPGEGNVSFYVGNIKLGEAPCVANAKIFPQDLTGAVRGTFDTEGKTARLVAFLLAASGNKTETWQIGNVTWENECEALSEGVARSDCNPKQLMIGSNARNALYSRTELPSNDNEFLDLINEVRENVEVGTGTLVIGDLTTIIDNSKVHLTNTLVEHGIVEEGYVVPTVPAEDEEEVVDVVDAEVASVMALRNFVINNPSSTTNNVHMIVGDTSSPIASTTKCLTINANGLEIVSIGGMKHASQGGSNYSLEVCTMSYVHDDYSTTFAGYENKYSVTFNNDSTGMTDVETTSLARGEFFLDESNNIHFGYNCSDTSWDNYNILESSCNM